MSCHLYVFAQFLRLLPKNEFLRIVNKYNGDHRTKHFKCWDQLACLILAHIRQEKSLRNIDIALNTHASKLFHIGIQQAPKSTLADANESRDYHIYEDFAKFLMLKAKREYTNTELSLNLENAIYALDASVIDLTLALYPWAKFRKTKAAIKLHTMIDLRGNLPSFLVITDGKVHDVKAAPSVPIEANGIYLIDRGYIDFAWLFRIHKQKAFFVTRLKDNIKWVRVISHSVDKKLGLICDQEILLTSKNLKELYPERLRRVSFRDGLQKITLVFLTNNFELPAATIAALYKARWEIELFFKWIKQNLRVKNFYGTSPNAVKTQIWISMIVYLSLAILKQRYQIPTSLSKMLHFLETNLFEKKPILSIFAVNPRYQNAFQPDNQLVLFES